MGEPVGMELSPAQQREIYAQIAAWRRAMRAAVDGGDAVIDSQLDAASGGNTGEPGDDQDDQAGTRWHALVNCLPGAPRESFCTQFDGAVMRCD